MSTNARATIFFESHDAEGWSESYWLQGTDLTAIKTSMETIIPLRAALLTISANIIYSRVSDVTVKGDSLVPNLPYPVLGLYHQSGKTVLEANTCLLIQVFASALIKNRIFLRGLESDVVIGREYQAPTAFVTALGAWESALATAGIQCRHRTSVGPPPVYTFTTATQVRFVGVSARKPGRPFGQPVGRRRR